MDIYKIGLERSEAIKVYGNIGMLPKKKRKWWQKFRFETDFTWKAFGLSISENINWYQSAIVILPFTRITIYFND